MMSKSKHHEPFTDLEADCPECGKPLPIPRSPARIRHAECQIAFRRRYNKEKKRRYAAARRLQKVKP
jgi:uncharacterized protein YbbK (DUF523 family)